MTACASKPSSTALDMAGLRVAGMGLVLVGLRVARARRGMVLVGLRVAISPAGRFQIRAMRPRRLLVPCRRPPRINPTLAQPWA